MPSRMRFRWWGHAWWSCKPRDSGEFLHRFAFSFVQTFAQAVKDSAFADPSLAIALRIIENGELMCDDFVLGAETGHLLAGKVCSIVRDNGVEEFERHTMFC